MATDIERLVARLEVQTTKFEKDMARARGEANRRTREIEADFGRMNSHLKGLLNEGSSIVSGGLGKIAAAAGAALSAKSLLDYSDAWQLAANKIAAAGEDAARVGPRLSQLTDIAVRSRTGLTETVDLYTSLKRATEDLKPSQAQLVKATENVNKAFVVGGQGAAAQAGGILQLGQALQSGVLQGDELRSIRENAPLIAKAIAETMGVPIAKLKELGSEGKITSDIVLKSLLNMGQGVEAQFARTTPTVQQSFANLRTNVTRFIGELDQQTGASGKLATRIQEVSNAIGTIGPTAATTAISILESFGAAQSWFNPVVAGATVAGTALALFGDSIRPVAGEFATLTDYAVAAFRTAQQVGGEAWAAISSAAQQAAEILNGVFSGLPSSSSDSMGQVLSAVRIVINAVIGAFVAAGQAVSAVWSGMTAGLAEQMVNAMNAAIAAVEGAVQKIVGALNGVTGAVGIAAIPTPSLGRIANAYQGAGAAAGQAFRDSFGAFTKDYIGDTVGAVDGALKRIRESASAVAAERAEQARESQRGRALSRLDDGDINKQLTPPKKQGDEAGGGGGGKKDTTNQFASELANLEKRIVALNREREALGLSTFEAAKAEATFKLLDAAKAAGIPITEELKDKVGKLAEAYATTKVSLDQAKASQEQFAELQKFVGSNLSSFFSDIVSGGENAQKALMNLTKRLADAALQAVLLGEGPLGKLLGGGTGGLVGMLFKGFSGGFGGGAGAPLSLLPKGLSTGGNFSPGRPITVGENGRETLIPTGYGRIVSANDRNAGGGGTVMVTIASDGTLPAMIRAEAQGVAVQVVRQGIDANNQKLPAMLAQRDAR